jgi:hypothetical protein
MDKNSLHKWIVTSWEYDDTFFECTKCHKKTNRRRGFPEDGGCAGEQVKEATMDQNRLLAECADMIRGLVSQTPEQADAKRELLGKLRALGDQAMKQEESELIRGVYEHYKGDEYIALHLVTHHETDEKFVVYISLKYGTLKIREYNTPGKDSWCDMVTVPVGPMGSSPKTGPRFKYVRRA